MQQHTISDAPTLYCVQFWRVRSPAEIGNGLRDALSHGMAQGERHQRRAAYGMYTIDEWLKQLTKKPPVLKAARDASRRISMKQIGRRVVEIVKHVIAKIIEPDFVCKSYRFLVGLPSAPMIKCDTYRAHGDA